MNAGRSSLRRWLPASLLALAILGAAPFMGWLRDRALTLLGDRFVGVLYAVLALVALGCLVWIARRIREDRVLRWGGVLGVVLLVVVQGALLNRGQARVDVVEKVHLLEYGLLAILSYRALGGMRHGGRLLGPLLVVVAVASLDEAVQWLVPTRVGEWKDVLLDAFGGACGLVLAVAMSPPGRLAAIPRGERPRWARWTVGTGLLLAAFFQCAHLGYRIESPGIGAFRSWHSPDGLVEVAARRAESWARSPPGPLELVGKEDLFRTEAAQHVQLRNAAIQQGDATTAWKEQQILARHFGPFLEFRPRHRLSPEETRQLARERRRPDRYYASPVLAGRIFVRPSKGVFWAGVAAAAMGLLLAFPRRSRVD